MVDSFTVSGITFAMKENPELKTARPKGVVSFVAEPDNKHDSNAVRIEQDGKFWGYVPADRDSQSNAKKFGTGRISSYKYHHPDWKKMGINKWNDDHIGHLKSIEIVIDDPKNPSGKIIGGRYMRVTSLLGYLNSGGTWDRAIKWAFDQGDSYEKYCSVMDNLQEVGTAMHDSIEKYFETGAKDEALPDGFDHWREKYNPATIYQEQRFWDDELMVTGKPDWVGMINYKGRDVLACVDWKSSKQVKLTHKMQASIYAKNIEVDGVKPEISMIVAWGNEKNKCGYAHSIVDNSEIERYYLASKHLKAVLDIAECPVNESKFK